jgi:hypothetical protein
MSGPEGGDFLVRYDSLLNAVDTLPLPEHPAGPAEIQVPVTGGVATYPKPFAGTTAWALTSDGGMWVAITDQYKLLRLSEDMDTVRVATKPFEPVPVPGEERDEILERFRDLGADLSRFAIPDSKPAIANLFVDDRDFAWVIPVLPGDETGSLAQVFDTLGVFLGEVQIPIRVRFSPVIIRDETLTAVTTDSLGVPYVVQFQIQKKSNG